MHMGMGMDMDMGMTQTICEDRAAWRAETLPLSTIDGVGRDSSYRDSIKEKYQRLQIEAKVDQDLSLNDKLKLTRTRYKNYVKCWDDAPSDDGYANFDNLHKERKGKFDLPDGTDLINSFQIAR
jgi:hypothetical protein